VLVRGQLLHAQIQAQDELVARPFIEIKPQPLSWLWCNHIVLGSLNLIEGDPGLGKSLLVSEIAARLSRGDPMPFCNGPAMRGQTILCCAEDPADTVIRPRLEAAGADLDLVHDLRHADGRPFRFPTDVPELRKVVEFLNAQRPDVPVRFVAIDPADAHIDRGAIKTKVLTEETRQAFMPLAAVGEEFQFAPTIVRHWSKAADTRNIKTRGSGDMQVLATARSALCVVPHPELPNTSVVAQVKGNYQGQVVALAYTFEELPAPDGDGGVLVNELGQEVKTCRICWTGTVEIDLESFNERQTKRQRARRLILRMIQQGWRLATEIEEAARKADISPKTLQRAKNDLGVKSAKEAGALAGPWYWGPKEATKLPPGPAV
jgi:hypothetical protein